MSEVSAISGGTSPTRIVDVFNATTILCAPFEVYLYESVKQVLSGSGGVVETVVPDPDGLVKAVAFMRALHPQKLDGDDL